MTEQSESISDRIIAEARSMIGLPFHHQGRDSAIGVDCRGLLLVIADRLGYQHADWRNDYAREPNPQEFRAALETDLVLLPSIEDALLGDVFLIRFPRQKPEEATHCAVLAEGPFESMLIHSFAGDYAGKVLEEPRRRWEPYLVAAFTWIPERFT